MEILKRYGQIMACNIKYLLEKSDNEEKIIRVYLREINEELKRANIVEGAITKEETMLMGELDSCKKQLKNIELSLKEANDKDAFDKLLIEKENLIRNRNRALRKQEVNVENEKRIISIKEKLNADLKLLNEHIEMKEKQKEESKVDDEVVCIKGDEETKNILSNILSKLEKHEK